MSTLIAIAYPDKDTDVRARAKLAELERQQLISLDDAVIATHEGDKIKLEQAVGLTGAGAASGALWGGIFGLIFLMPIAGMAIGAATGAITGHFSAYGIEDKFAKEIGAKVTPGKAALVLQVRSATPDRVIAEMKKNDFGGKLIQTSLSTEDEQSFATQQRPHRAVVSPPDEV